MRIIQFLCAVMLVFAAPALAKPGPTGWTVSQRSGQVQVVRPGARPAALHASSRLAPGDIIATGADGRALLTRGNDYVVVAPSSRLELPAEETTSGFTRLVQQLGTLFYKVQHTGVPHFAVETPMLAAVVKGTSFTVIVGEDRSAVQVTEGVVEVTSALGGDPRLVHGGATVVVDRNRPGEIIQIGPGTTEDLGTGASVKIDAAGDVPLAEIVKATGGLVSETLAGDVKLPRLQSTAPVLGTSNPAAPVSESPVVSPIAEAILPTTVPVATSPTPTAPTLSAPILATPTVATPSLTTPTLATPTLSTPTLTAPALTSPSLTAPALTSPSLPSAGTTVPSLTTPTLSAPTLTAPTVTAPTVTAPTVPAPTVTVPTVTVPTVAAPTVTVPSPPAPPPLPGL